MGVTANFALPYPELSDPPNGPSQVEALADAVDLELLNVQSDLAALSPYPRGIVGWATRTTATGTTAAADLGVLRRDGISLVAGRMYAIQSSGLPLRASAANAEVIARFRYSTSGTATIASPLVPAADKAHARLVDPNFGEDRVLWALYTPAGNETMSLLLCVGLSAGAGVASLSDFDGLNTIQIAVFDVGAAQAHSSVVL